jgi:hypothetical protein
MVRSNTNGVACVLRQGSTIAAPQVQEQQLAPVSEPDSGDDPW